MFSSHSLKRKTSAVKEAFPNVGWENAYKEFKAAGQSEKDAAPK